MPRSRMIKPDFWDDEKLATISLSARLIFIGLWNMSDDYGVVKGNHIWLKNQLFPYECVSINEMDKYLKEIENIKRITPFKNSSEKYYLICNFLKHQKVQHPSQTRNPEPPKNLLEESGFS